MNESWSRLYSLTIWFPRYNKHFVLYQNNLSVTVKCVHMAKLIKPFSSTALYASYISSRINSKNIPFRSDIIDFNRIEILLFCMHENMLFMQFHFSMRALALVFVNTLHFSYIDNFAFEIDKKYWRTAYTQRHLVFTVTTFPRTCNIQFKERLCSTKNLSMSSVTMHSATK